MNNKTKKRTPKQGELLNLLNYLLDTVSTDKTLTSKSQEDENENENDEILMSSKNEKKKMLKIKKPVPILKKWQIKKKMRIKTFC